MSTVRQDFVGTAGSALAIGFTVPGANLNSGTLTWKLSKSPGGAAVLTKTSGSGIGSITATSCVVSISDGEVVSPGLYFFELKQTIAGTTPLAFGRAVFRSAPT
jgi:hypothetical protein